MSKTYKLSNSELVKELKEVLAAMEVKDYAYFKVRAYQNVIGVIESLTRSVFNLWENNRISEIPGVGGGLKAHFDELFTTGKVVEFEAIKHDLPQGMFELIGLRGIGAKKAFKLSAAFKINKRKDALEKVKKAAEDGKIQTLPGFGEKSEKQILEAISEIKKTKNEKERILLINAEKISDRVIAYLESHPEIEDAISLGSLRRRASTVGDLDIAIKTTNPEAARNHFLKYDEIEEVLVNGEQRASVVMADDVQVDIRVCTKENYGSMLQYFTGSKAHNIVLRTYALEKKNCSLSEYGIKKGGELNEFSSEERFYEFLDLQYIPPELRQGKNEVDLASKKKLPKVVSIGDIKGDLHTHTIASDGVNTLQEMVQAAIELEYEYIGISDHAPSVQSRGLKEVEKIVQETRENIDQLNKAQSDIKILYGYEVNILADATISLPDEILSQLDYAIASIHGAFKQDRAQITKRLINAVENPYINIIGHPSGRLINEREPYDVDWRKFFTAVKDNDKILEINSQPNRLDLAEDLVEDAVNRGIELMINTDAHAFGQLELMTYGVDVARRGWCLSEHITNTLNLQEFEEKLATSSDR